MVIEGGEKKRRMMRIHVWAQKITKLIVQVCIRKSIATQTDDPNKRYPHLFPFLRLNNLHQIVHFLPFFMTYGYFDRIWCFVFPPTSIGAIHNKWFQGETIFSVLLFCFWDMTKHYLLTLNFIKIWKAVIWDHEEDVSSIG